MKRPRRLASFLFCSLLFLPWLAPAAGLDRPNILWITSEDHGPQICSNNAKEDYNLDKPGKVWDDSSKNAHLFLHGFRGRMDERYDLVRSVTDGRYVYVRNYMPHLIYGQHLDYMWPTPTTRVWEQLHNDGKLTPTQSAFWNRKPPEELYDLQSDPDEVKNVAASPAHAAIKAKLRQAQQSHALRIRDVGFIPEGERFARSQGGSPYDLGQDDRKATPLSAMIKSMPTNGPAPDARFKSYVPRLVEDLQARFK